MTLRKMNRTNAPGTCPWCGQKLRTWEWRDTWREVRNPDYEKQMREWQAHCEAAPEGSLLRRTREKNPPPSFVRSVERERGPARNVYAPFCSLRCGLAFGQAAHVNGYRLTPYTEQ